MDMGKDLVVNRAKLGREGCMRVIAAAYRAKLAELGIDEQTQKKPTVEPEYTTLHVDAKVE